MFSPKLRRPAICAVARARVHAAGDHARGKQRASLGAMDVLQRLRVGMHVLGLQVHDLAADHAADGAGGVRDLGDDGHARLRRTLQARQHLVGVGLQRVAGKDGRRLAKSFVAGGTAAAQVVVVERRQVVVDERVGVQHLQRRAQFLDAGGNAALDHLRGFHAEDGPQALAAGEDAMPHGLVDRRRILRTRGQQALQRLRR